MILKAIWDFFTRWENTMESEERFINAHNPTSIQDIEHWSREYDRLRFNKHRRFGY